MKKTMIAAALASCFLAGCGSNPVKLRLNKQQQLLKRKVKLMGSFGVDLSARDLNVKPGDDFFMYASGTWYNNYVMPADKTRYGAFNALAERSEAQVKEIIDDIISRDNLNAEEQMVADFYTAYMDTDTINKKGIAPIQPILNDINAVQNTDDLTRIFGQSWLTGVSAPSVVVCGLTA